jgi:hypothetical protein
MLSIDSDNLIEATLTDAVTGLTVDDATASAVLKDEAGATVAGSAVALAFVAAGLYRGVLPHSVALVPNEGYVVEITATRGASQLFVRRPVTVGYSEG